MLRAVVSLDPVTSSHIICRPFLIPPSPRSVSVISKHFISLPLITMFGILVLLRVILAFFPPRTAFYLLPLMIAPCSLHPILNLNWEAPGVSVNGQLPPWVFWAGRRCQRDERYHGHPSSSCLQALPAGASGKSCEDTET